MYIQNVLKSLENKYIAFGARTALKLNEVTVKSFQGIQRFASSPEVNAVMATLVDPEIKENIQMKDSRFRTVITLPFLSKEEWKEHVEATNELTSLIMEKYFNYYQNISEGLNGVNK